MKNTIEIFATGINQTALHANVNIRTMGSRCLEYIYEGEMICYCFSDEFVSTGSFMVWPLAFEQPIKVFKDRQDIAPRINIAIDNDKTRMSMYYF